jgi:hypothetical protein
LCVSVTQVSTNTLQSTMADEELIDYDEQEEETQIVAEKESKK